MGSADGKTHPVANKAEMIKKIMVFINLFRQTLQLILINVLNFLRLDAQIIQCLTLGAVVETYHDLASRHQMLPF